MSTRPKLPPDQVIVNGPMSGDITSKVTILSSSLFSYTFSWNGSSPVGTIVFQASNDYTQYPNGTANNAGTWNTLTVNLNGSAVTSVPVSGNTGQGAVDCGPTGLYAVRTVYTASSGTGVLNAFISGRAT